MTAKAKYFPLAAAARVSLRNYTLATFKHDAIAGLVVSLIALPLAMALAIAVGLPPQHGVYTAIIAGGAVALLGGSITQVSGPTAAFVAIIVPIVSDHGLHGLIWCEIIAGFLLILMGVARFGRYIHYVPYPVTTGFTAGIAVVIATLALNDFLGLELGSLKGDYLEKASVIFNHLPDINIYEFAVGFMTLLAVLFAGNLIRIVPSTMIGLLAGTFLAYAFAVVSLVLSTRGAL